MTIDRNHVLPGQLGLFDFLNAPDPFAEEAARKRAEERAQREEARAMERAARERFTAYLKGETDTPSAEDGGAK